MKTFTKSVLITSAFIFGAIYTQAQTRNVDLSFEAVNAPADGAVIANGADVNLEVIIKNNGTDDLIQGDSIAISGGPFPSGQAAVAVLSQAVPSGASITITSQNSIFTNSRTESTDETVQWCFTVNTARALSTGSPVVDNNSANNEKCISVTLKGRSTSILDVNKNVVKAEAFPNPATGKVNIKLNTEKSGNTDAVVTDLTGRKIFSQTFPNQPAGSNTYTIDLKDLAQGTYIITLQTADGKKGVSKVQLK